jgi:TetR/AcrR family transcriptional regulator, transcriptional repressor for nem operon
MSAVDTKSSLLAEAETLVRTVGYTAFSYADLSERVGIRKASIHHHFPTKEALGNALIDGYLARFVKDLEQLSERRLDIKGKLTAYGEFFSAGMRDGLMPLCGALAADAAYLPQSMRVRVDRFFRLHLVRADVKPERAAMLVLSALQGASLVAWALRDPAVIKPTLRDVIEGLTR